MGLPGFQVFGAKFWWASGVNGGRKGGKAGEGGLCGGPQCPVSHVRHALPRNVASCVMWLPALPPFFWASANRSSKSPGSPSLPAFLGEATRIAHQKSPPFTTFVRFTGGWQPL